MTSSNVTWQEGALQRAERWQALGQRGATLWLTGLPAPGKSTIAAVVAAAAAVLDVLGAALRRRRSR
ncbi:MAG: adenylylsulfate kinase [Conexibacter sp.]|nr:adenylylsulfate kinase [Conexibacter sp.]